MNTGMSMGARSGGLVLPFDMLFMDNTGQSLGNSSVGGAPITVTQSGTDFAYPYGEEAPTSFLDAVATDSNVIGLDATRNLPGPENPMFGMMEFLRELLAREDNYNVDGRGLLMGTANNARGSYPIGNFNRATTGTSPYSLWYNQCVSAKTYADANGRTLLCPFSHLIQGEAEFDDASGYATWKAAASQQATDRASDASALGVDNNLGHRYFIYQTMSRPPGNSDHGPARAQYDLSVEAPDLVTLTTPNYPFDFSGDSTGIHIVTQDAKWLGAYAALAFKRIFIDKVDWLTPVPTPSIDGNYVNLTYANIRGSSLVEDTTWLPAQPNLGWTATDGAGGDVAIVSAAVIDATTVRLEFGSAPQSGWELSYALNVTSNRDDNYTGGTGNIRDNHGDNCKYIGNDRPMHNWLPGHRITL